MMQEMYEWYMDNLFPEHRRQAIKHAEKDSRDRKKRLGRGPREKPVLQEDLMDYFSPTAWGRRSFGEYSGRSKWERIGSPFVASVVDWAIIINPIGPAGWQDPKGRRMKLAAIKRQYDRYQEYSS